MRMLIYVLGQEGYERMYRSYFINRTQSHDITLLIFALELTEAQRIAATCAYHQSPPDSTLLIYILVRSSESSIYIQLYPPAQLLINVLASVQSDQSSSRTYFQLFYDITLLTSV